MAPTWEKVGQHFAQDPDIVVAKIDASANDNPAVVVAVSGTRTHYTHIGRVADYWFFMRRDTPPSSCSLPVTRATRLSTRGSLATSMISLRLSRTTPRTSTQHAPHTHERITRTRTTARAHARAHLFLAVPSRILATGMLMATTMTTCNARVDVGLSLSLSFVRVRPVSSGRQCIPSKLSFLGGGGVTLVTSSWCVCAPQVD